MKVYFTNIRHGLGRCSHIIYGELRDASNGEIIISATLSFLLDAIEARDYIVVAGKGK